MNLKLIWHHMSARKKRDIAFGSALAVIISGPFLLAIVSNIWTSLLDGSHEDIVDGIFSLLGFGALLVFIGGVVVFIAYLGKLEYDRYGTPNQLWPEVARDLGLRYDTEGRGGKPILTGMWRDQYVEITLHYLRHHRMPNTPHTTVSLPLRRCPTEGFGLYPTAHGVPSIPGVKFALGVFTPVPGRFTIRDKSLDSVYTFYAEKEGEGWNLLQQPPILRWLHASRTDPWKVKITNGWVGLEAQGRRADSAELTNVLDHCLALRQTIESAPAPAPEMPEELRLKEAWFHVAWLFGLPFDPELKLLSGQVRKVGVQVWRESIDGVEWTRFRLLLAHPLEGEIEVMPRVTAEAFPERVDRLRVVELGDRVFDRRFVVQASSAEAARARLNQQCRDLMIYCQDKARGLWLRPQELRLEYEGVMRQSDDLTKAIQALLDLAKALGRQR